MGIIKYTMAYELQAPDPLSGVFGAVVRALTEPVGFKEGLVKYKDIKHMAGHVEIRMLDESSDREELGLWDIGLRGHVAGQSSPMTVFGVSEGGISRVRGIWHLDPPSNTRSAIINGSRAGASFMKVFLRRASDALDINAEIVPIKG